MPDSGFKLSSLALILFLLLVASVLVYHGVSRYQQFHRFQAGNARIIANEVATEVGLFIAEKRRLVSIFTREHLIHIAQTVYNESTVMENYAYLHNRANLYFPDYFALTILDHNLRPAIDDFDGLIGDLCLQDTRKALDSQEYSTRIHPNPIAYHFDIVSPWKYKKTTGVFLISFHADFLGRMLRSRQIPGFTLILVDKVANNTIEVTADGARINWLRDNYQLKPDELERILVETPVENTRWHVYTLHNKELFNEESRRIILEAAIIFTAFAFLVAIALWRIYLEANRRQQAEQVKNEFISLINHELRTPLTAIRGSLGLIANGVTDNMKGKTVELAKLALNNAEHLGQLVDDFLDVQKLSSGKLEYHKEQVRILPLVRLVLENYNSYADKFGATFRLAADSDDCEILADPHRLEQVLANLLSNAVKYGRKNDTIDVALERKSDCIRVSVTDHGDGIAEDFQDRLFHAFAQSESQREHVIKGTGLGLYIAKAIIKEHDGEIGFETSKGNGTCFWFELPAA